MDNQQKRDQEQTAWDSEQQQQASRAEAQDVEAPTQARAEAGAPALSPEDAAREKQAISRQKLKKEIREWVVSIAFALVAVFIIRTFLFTVISVDGQSMETTLHDKERLIVTVLDMKLHGPQRGDVVICHYPERGLTNFVKRVIGVPGDTIWMAGGKTYVNLQELPEPYVADPDLHGYGPFTVPEGEYFLMGDNRNHSNDSRSVGFISKDKILGKVRFVFWPLGDIRVIQ